jgi:hypothetical protein
MTGRYRRVSSNLVENASMIPYRNGALERARIAPSVAATKRTPTMAVTQNACLSESCRGCMQTPLSVSM